MKTFEERYAAWIDGMLEGEELREFELQIENRAAAEADRADALKLGALLRTKGAAPSLTNADFFTHQLLERIEAEARPAGAREPRVKSRGFIWPLQHLAWGGVCCLAIAFSLYHTAVKEGLPGTISAGRTAAASQNEGDDAFPYDASIIDAKPMEPGVYATSLHSEKEDMTVLWLDGLEYLPASYKLQ